MRMEGEASRQEFVDRMLVQARGALVTQSLYTIFV